MERDVYYLFAVLLIFVSGKWTIIDSLRFSFGEVTFIWGDWCLFVTHCYPLFPQTTLAIQISHWKLLSLTVVLTLNLASSPTTIDAHGWPSVRQHCIVYPTVKGLLTDAWLSSDHYSLKQLLISTVSEHSSFYNCFQSSWKFETITWNIEDSIV